ncbi:hypothetical protein CHS0354_039814 [Potamilus streckersoni]|uniref:CABIT domain-containing protein n=1 Tax=Potamilus streckersoni TaxID=2493646 RepID=A0AAE0SRR7_9BIVA|nr:hypothetical protein CHS0354_039814 [Potamilus streckersoni]
MEFVVSHKDYSVSDFYTNFSSQFPILAVVTQGWHGHILETTFDKDQVMRLKSSITRKRVLGYPLSMDVEQSQKCWSIPLDEDICVTPVDKDLKRAGNEMLLTDIIKRYKSPTLVEFPSKLLFPNQGQCRFMKLTSIHHVNYMIGNHVNYGKLELKEIEVPLYLTGLRLALITGIKNRSMEDFNKYCRDLERMPSTKVFPDRNRVVAVYNPEYDRLETDYTLREPISFHSIAEAFHSANPGNSSSNSERKKIFEKKDYQNIPNSLPPPVPPRAFKKKGVKPQPMPNDSRGIKNKPLPQLPQKQVSTVSENNNIETRPSSSNAGAVSQRRKSSVSSLTIKEVELALRELRLQEHFTKFEDQMVDGKILSKLSEDILVMEFGLSRTEAIRLMSFVQEGHIPT